jgi:uncharacterized protein YndB with AHSA1/START domain
MTAQPKPVVIVTRRFDAPSERVFDAWLTPELIGQWMFGPALRGEEVVRISVDARVGGRFSFLVRRQGTEIDHVGQYVEIDRPRRLVFSWAAGADTEDPSLVTIEIASQGAGCKLTLTHEMQPKWADYLARVREEWTKELEALATTL